MKTAFVVLLLTLSAVAQQKPEVCPDRADMQEEITEAQALVGRMQSRIVMMRNSAGTVQDFQIRNALQVNADAWQDMLDSLKHRVDRLQSAVERCEAREKIQGRTPK